MEDKKGKIIRLLVISISILIINIGFIFIKTANPYFLQISSDNLFVMMSGIEYYTSIIGAVCCSFISPIILWSFIGKPNNKISRNFGYISAALTVLLFVIGVLFLNSPRLTILIPALSALTFVYILSIPIICFIFIYGTIYKYSENKKQKLSKQDNIQDIIQIYIQWILFIIINIIAANIAIIA